MKKAMDLIRKYHMIGPGDGIVAGVSGGADSVCLLLVLRELEQAMGLKLHVVHVEHGIRGEESLRDAEYVERLCREMGVDFHCIRADIPALAAEWGISAEEAGRKVRYEAFERVRIECRAQKIAVAHNRNDQAETMLFQMARGSGLDGAAGIAPVRGHVIRPLLDCSREEIEDYLTARHMIWRTDATNEEDIYSRNVIRRRVLPVLKDSINEGVCEHLAALGEELRQVKAYLADETRKAYERCAVISGSGDRILLMIPQFLEESPYLRERIIRLCLEQTGCGLKNIRRVHIEDACALAEKQSGRGIMLPGGRKVFREFDHLVICRDGGSQDSANSPGGGSGGLAVSRSGGSQDPANRPKGEHGGHVTGTDPQETELAVPGTTRTAWGTFTVRVLPNEKQRIEQKQYTKWLDYDKISSAVRIRTRMPGDYVTISENGAKKKLKTYFAEEKIPVSERTRIPLVTCGSDVLWVVGKRIGAAWKVGPGTKQILEIRLEEEPE